LVLTRPCVFCTVRFSSAFFQFSQPLPVHSMKTMREVAGIALRSFTFSTSGFRTMPWINSRCFAGSISGTPAWLRS